MEKIQKIPPAVLQQPDPGRGGDYQERTGCTDSKAKKLCRWLAGEKLLVYAPLLEWYLDHGLEITAVYQTIDYQPRKIFTWFVNEVTEEQAQRGQKPQQGPPHGGVQASEEQRPRQADENKEQQTRLVYTKDWELLNKALRSVWFDDLEEIKDVFEIEFRNAQVEINHPFQVGIVVYQLAKLCILQFYYDGLAQYPDRRDFELIQMDMDSMYLGLSCNIFEEAVKPELAEELQDRKNEWFSWDKYSGPTPRLFKKEFKGMRGMKAYKNPECPPRECPSAKTSSRGLATKRH